jgi:2-amino-4-hydroxy-6-hydroxymethyldihydropteridine diphosphokinase
VIQLHTHFAAPLLLEKILSIEHEIGRIRQEKYGPRIIDIDILLFGDQVIETPGLIIPHPRIAERRFVLVPLAGIAPELIHPVLHESIQVLLNKCTDPLTVKKFL